MLRETELARNLDPIPAPEPYVEHRGLSVCEDTPLTYRLYVESVIDDRDPWPKVALDRDQKRCDMAILDRGLAALVPDLRADRPPHD